MTPLVWKTVTAAAVVWAGVATWAASTGFTLEPSFYATVLGSAVGVAAGAGITMWALPKVERRLDDARLQQAEAAAAFATGRLVAGMAERLSMYTQHDVPFDIRADLLDAYGRVLGHLRVLRDPDLDTNLSLMADTLDVAISMVQAGFDGTATPTRTSVFAAQLKGLIGIALDDPWERAIERLRVEARALLDA